VTQSTLGFMYVYVLLILNGVKKKSFVFDYWLSFVKNARLFKMIISSYDQKNNFLFETAAKSIDYGI